MGWVRAHTQKDSSRVEAREDRRRAVVRVESGQPTRFCLPSTVLGFTFHPPVCPQVREPCHRQETLWVRPVKRQEVRGLRELAGVGGESTGEKD